MSFVTKLLLSILTGVLDVLRYIALNTLFRNTAKAAAAKRAEAEALAAKSAEAVSEFRAIDAKFRSSGDPDSTDL